MAMLRNLRNMIKAGVSEKHNRWIIRKLTDEGAVIHSRQFPFRFFSAYEVLDDLEKEFDRTRESSFSRHIYICLCHMMELRESVISEKFLTIDTRLRQHSMKLNLKQEIAKILSCKVVQKQPDIMFVQLAAYNSFRLIQHGGYLDIFSLCS